jgi:hypothetical protein
MDHLRLISRQIGIIGKALTKISVVIPRATTVRGMAAGAPQDAPGRPPRAKLRLSPARRADLRLQGQYMGFTRSLRPRQKAQVKATREAKGIRAAIALAKRLGAA